MGLFRKPLTPEELEKKARYEAAKVRLMELHKKADVIYYIDEITTDYNTRKFVLIGEVGKGQLHNGDCMDIYSNEGLKVGTMVIDTQEEREERHFIPGRTIRTFCFPKESRDDYAAGQMLVKLPICNTKE